jgi:hypothetical protein
MNVSILFKLAKKLVAARCIENPGDVVYWEDNAYIASGTTSRILATEEILELRIKLPGLTDYSNQPAHGEYDKKLIQAFIQKI